MLYFTVISLFSYLLGSISTAVILSEKIYGTDIRTLGSGNAGATNALRSFGAKAGALVFLVDFSKGLIAVAAARAAVYFLNAPYECILAAGFFAQLGHTLPVFFRFRGGKGVATAAGAAVGIMPFAALILIALFAVTAVLTKYVSLASAVSAAAYPLLALYLSGNNGEKNFVYAVSCAVMICVKHAPNFLRLIRSEENRMDFSKTHKSNNSE